MDSKRNVGVQDSVETYHTAPIFIMGCQRSGTTLVSQMLTNHSSLAIYHESFFYHIFFNELKYYGNLEHSCNLRRMVNDVSNVIAAKSTMEGNSEIKFAPDADQIMESVRGNRFEDVMTAVFEQYATTHGKRRGGDKTPENYLFINEILSGFPDSPVIYVIRDPRDTALSCSHVFGASIEKTAMMWNDSFDMFSSTAKSVHLVQYEQLVADPKAVLKEICQYIGEAYDPGMLSFYEKLPAEYAQFEKKGLLGKPISSASVGKFRDMPEEDIRNIEAWCAEGMSAMGYEFTIPEAERLKVKMSKSEKPSFLMMLLERLRYYGLNASRWQHGWPRWRLMIGHRLRYFSGLTLLKSLSSAGKNQSKSE